jgi:hypothetical protein
MTVSLVVAGQGHSRTKTEGSAPAEIVAVDARNGGDAGRKTASGIHQALRPGVIAFNPIPVDAPPIADIAGELNRWAEGLGIHPSMIVSEVLATDRTLVPARESGAWELVIESCRAAEGFALQEIVPVAVEGPPVRNGLPDPIADFFEENPYGYEPSGEGLASSAVCEAPVRAARPQFDPIELPADLAGGIAEELNRFAEGIGIGAEDTLSPIVRSPRFEPIEPPTDTHSGIAYELNHRSEGLDLVPPQVGDALQARQATADSGWDQALRLTRAAACAWMDVLKGPARVTMNWQ